MRALKYKLVLLTVAAVSLACVGIVSFGSGLAYAADTPISGPVKHTDPPVDKTKPHCGEQAGDTTPVQTSIDIGCRGKGNPIIDMMFAVIRLLSNGVGLIVIGSIIVGGIQYTTSAGDPQATAKAVGRIRSTLIALGLYIIAYPLLNYVLPAGFFN